MRLSEINDVYLMKRCCFVLYRVLDPKYLLLYWLFEALMTSHSHLQLRQSRNNIGQLLLRGKKNKSFFTALSIKLETSTGLT